MPDPIVEPRRYDNRGRAEQARLARRRVIDAAHELFLDGGWAATTVAGVAARAGVSVETVYKRFGNKASLLQAVHDVRLAGDDEPVPIAERPAIRAMTEEPDPHRIVERYAALARDVVERAGPLMSVLLRVRGVDDDLTAFLATVDGERLTGATGCVSLLAARNALRPGLDVDEARDVVWALISPELYDLLVARRGWSLDDYQDWLTRSLATTLLVT